MALGLAGCRESASSASAPAPVPASVPLALALIDDFNPPRPTPNDGSAPAAAWDAALGGLSGLFYSEREQLLYALSDDRGRFPPRFYTFSVELGEHALRVVPRAVVLLHETAPTGSLVDMDGEGLAGAGDSLFLSLEGNAEPAQQRETRMLRVTRAGLVTGELGVPQAFRSAPSGQPPRGARHNLGLEGLSTSPSGRFLFACSEAALYQDGPPPSFDQGSDVRVLRWDLQQGGEPVEFLYRTEPVVPRLDSPSVAAAGVSEILALDDAHLLLLERSYVQAGERHVNTIRIFETSLPAAPANGPSPRLAKRLVLDLADVAGGFDEGLRELDNFEGMTLGPRAASGQRSLLLVSDDNFSARQRTVFVALELRGD